MKKREVEYLILTFLFVLSFTIYMSKEISSPLLFGIDGPYYYIQVSSILSNGCMKYPDPPLAFYILTLFALITHDIILGIKIGSVFMMLLSLYVIYFFGEASRRRSEWLLSLYILYFLTFSSSA